MTAQTDVTDKGPTSSDDRINRQSWFVQWRADIAAGRDPDPWPTQFEWFLSHVEKSIRYAVIDSDEQEVLHEWIVAFLERGELQPLIDMVVDFVTVLLWKLAEQRDVDFEFNHLSVVMLDPLLFFDIGDTDGYWQHYASATPESLDHDNREFSEVVIDTAREWLGLEPREV